MNSQRTKQEKPVPQGSRAQGAAAKSGGQPSADAGKSREPQELAQAVRSVMHPESHEPEWRYVYGAING